MSNLLSSLHRQGFIERAPDPAGGRIVLARLTRSGKGLMARCFRHIDAIETEFTAEVSATDLETTLEVLALWAKRFEELKEPVQMSDRLATGAGGEASRRRTTPGGTRWQ
jgi:DNA-binding MarR family transcriptional regulator